MLYIIPIQAYGRFLYDRTRNVRVSGGGKVEAFVIYFIRGRICVYTGPKVWETGAEGWPRTPLPFGIVPRLRQIVRHTLGNRGHGNITSYECVYIQGAG